MQNFIAQSMRRMGLAPSGKVNPESPNSGDGGGGTAPLAHMEISDKWSYSSLEYPMDIQSRTDLGHYMMFYVNVPTTSKYGRKNSMSGRTDNIGAGSIRVPEPKQSQAQKGVLSGQTYSESQQQSAPNSSGKSWKPGTVNKVIERKSHQGTASDVTGVKRTHRTNDAIILYMPAQVLTNYTSSYKNTELGANVGEIAGMASKAEASGSGVIDLIKGGAGLGAHMVERAGLGMIGAALGGDINSARDKLSNRAQNNFLEATFTGIDFRKFSFSWKFTPKSPDEVKQVQKIIKTFKFHMLPEIKGGNHGRWFTTPAEFDLFYMFRGDENTYLNKIHTCVLLNMEVNYAPNGYQTFRPLDDKSNTGAPPTEIDMKLDFQETKLITKEDVELGF